MLKIQIKPENIARMWPSHYEWHKTLREYSSHIGKLLSNSAQKSFTSLTNE